MISYLNNKNVNVIAIAPQFILENKVFYIKPEIIKINNLDYTFYKKISNGTYGHVYSYSCYKNKIAIKISDNVEDLYCDIFVLNKLKENDYNHVIVESIICDYEYKFQGEKYSIKIIIMEYYDGNILDFVHGIFNDLDDNSKYKFILDIVKQIIISIKYLLDNGLFFADVTPNNILYKNISFHSVKIVLCDLGSAYPINDMYCVTFPSIKNKLSDGNIENITEYDLIWSICVTIMYLLVDKKNLTFSNICNTFLYKYIKNKNDDDIYNQIDNIKNMILNKDIDESTKKKYEKIFCLMSSKIYNVTLNDFLVCFN